MLLWVNGMAWVNGDAWTGAHRSESTDMWDWLQAMERADAL
jgi:hypothetical protein